MEKEKTDEIVVHKMIHFNGMPYLDEVRISFGEVDIILSAAKFSMLASCISDKVAADFRKTKELYDKYYAEVEQMHALVRELRGIFYYPGDPFSFIKNREDIDYGKLDDILGEYSALLGYE